MMEAFAIFNEIATSGSGDSASGTWGRNERFKRYRALALFNAAVCMQHLPVRPAKAVIGDLLQRAVEAIGDAVIDRTQAILSVATDALDRTKHEPLSWRGSTLVPSTRGGRQRIVALSHASTVTATWGGVRDFLFSFGLLAPAVCVVRAAVVVAHPRPRSISIGAA